MVFKISNRSKRRAGQRMVEVREMVEEPTFEIDINTREVVEKKVYVEKVRMVPESEVDHENMKVTGDARFVGGAGSGAPATKVGLRGRGMRRTRTGDSSFM